MQTSKDPSPPVRLPFLLRDHQPIIPFLEVRRAMPDEWLCRRLSLLSTNNALDAIYKLALDCYALDSRRDKILHLIWNLRHCNGTKAAEWFLALDSGCRFFVQFALLVYGLKLVSRRV